MIFSENEFYKYSSIKFKVFMKYIIFIYFDKILNLINILVHIIIFQCLIWYLKYKQTITVKLHNYKCLNYIIILYESLLAKIT